MLVVLKNTKNASVNLAGSEMGTLAKVQLRLRSELELQDLSRRNLNLRNLIIKPNRLKSHVLPKNLDQPRVNPRGRLSDLELELPNVHDIKIFKYLKYVYFPAYDIFE